MAMNHVDTNNYDLLKVAVLKKYEIEAEEFPQELYTRLKESF